MSEKSVKCLTCKHYAKNSSCSPCMDQGTRIIHAIDLSISAEIVRPDEEQNTYKYSCKIIMRYPEDFNNVDPYDCKYYLPSCLGFR
ncbi:MAG: hypothetical protein JW891_09855 [Candidatus Lokiarchaeota archaeon]|nr:hypothetical protein [Candidatus Lokiarchaeota archaeon]